MAYEVRHHKLHHHMKPHMRQHRYYPPQLPTTSTEPAPLPPTAYPPNYAIPYSPPPAQQLSASQYNFPPISYQPISTITAIEDSVQREQRLQQALADVRRHGRNEHIGEIGAAAAGAFALYELHEAKVDPAHARRHKLEAEVAGAVALGSASYALHEHQEKKKSQILVNQLQTNSGSSGRTAGHLNLHGLPSPKNKHGAASLTKDKNELLSHGHTHPSHNSKHPHRHRFWP